LPPAPGVQSPYAAHAVKDRCEDRKTVSTEIRVWVENGKSPAEKNNDEFRATGDWGIITPPPALLGRSMHAMSMHTSDHESNFLQRPSGQITLLILAALVLGALGWFYVW